MYSSIEKFLPEWAEESTFTAKLFTLIPDDQLNVVPGKGIRTAGRLAWHITQTISEMGCRAGLFDGDDLERIPQPASAKEIASVYTQYSDKLKVAITARWNNDMLEEEKAMYGEQWSNGKILDVLIRHQTHHRGQLTVVMRLLGLAIPGFYGPSAEEWEKMGMKAME